MNSYYLIEIVIFKQKIKNTNVYGKTIEKTAL